MLDNEVNNEEMATAAGPVQIAVGYKTCRILRLQQVLESDNFEKDLLRNENIRLCGIKLLDIFVFLSSFSVVLERDVHAVVVRNRLLLSFRNYGFSLPRVISKLSRHVHGHFFFNEL